MRLFIYAVFDSASGVYDRPWVAQADAAAIRSFGDLAANADHMVGMHPEHFSLFRLGTYDDNTAKIEPEDAVCIARAHELVAAARQIPPGFLQDGNGGLVELGKELAEVAENA